MTPVVFPSTSPILILIFAIPYQQAEEATVWVDEMGNYYEANGQREYYEYHDDPRSNGYYYDDTHQQGYDQPYYYDESQGEYDYYDGQTEYEYSQEPRNDGEYNGLVSCPFRSPSFVRQIFFSNACFLTYFNKQPKQNGYFLTLPPLQATTKERVRCPPVSSNQNTHPATLHTTILAIRPGPRPRMMITK